MSTVVNPDPIADYWAKLPQAQDFNQFLEICAMPTPHEFVMEREGFTDRQGRVHMVKYVEWHYVTDFLDRVWPEWACSVQGQPTVMGNTVSVTVNLKIGNVVRSGVGTGDTGKGGELAIKKAEHDALKRAAIKFGIARELYQDDDTVISGSGPIAPKFGGPGSSVVTQQPATAPIQPMQQPAAPPQAQASVQPPTMAERPPQGAQGAVAANAQAAQPQYYAQAQYAQAQGYTAPPPMNATAPAPQTQGQAAPPQRQQQQGQSEQRQYKEIDIHTIQNPYAQSQDKVVTQPQYNLAHKMAREKGYGDAFNVATTVWPVIVGQVTDIDQFSKVAVSALINHISKLEQLPF